MLRPGSLIAQSPGAREGRLKASIIPGIGKVPHRSRIRAFPAACAPTRSARRAMAMTAPGRAAEIARALDDVADLFKAIWGLWYNATVGSRDLENARARAEELVALSEARKRTITFWKPSI